jgi:serine/alanine adding enzyme
MLDIFFSTSYGKLNEIIEYGSFEILNFECEYGEVRYGFIKRKIDIIPPDGLTYYDIITPYGYGGPLIVSSTNKGKLVGAFNNSFSEFCSQNNIVSEFVRFHLFDNIEFREYFYGEVSHISVNIIRDLKPSIEEIWMEFEAKVRKNVKRAISNGLEIIIDTDGTFIGDFLKIYYSTMDRNRASSYYYFSEQYFHNLNTWLRGNFVYFHVVLDNKIISTELVLYSEKYAYSFLGGTLFEFFEFRPNDFLKYEIIKWCKDAKLKFFVLGGGTSIDDGITRYKKSFAPSLSADFYIGKKIHNKEIYDILTQKRSENDPFDNNTKYFPKYRG